jgi:hypothetical protein
MIENKWKRFAVSQTLADWGDIDSSDLFDRMVIEDASGLEALFCEYEVIVWEPFEDWDITNVRDQIENLANMAQETEND